MRAILIRIGLDQSFGGGNAPIDPQTGRFLYVPIPESASIFHPGCERRYEEVVEPLNRFAGDCGETALPLQSCVQKMREQPMHLDPDFEHLTYGDDGSRRGSKVRTLASGDLLVFYAGLKPVRPCGQDLIYGIVGLFTVDRVLTVQEVKQDHWHKNAHTRKEKWGPSDIVVRAKRGSSGRCSRCVPIGEYRDGAYRIKRDLLEQWNGLNVKDGYIQRSAVPPEFNVASRFYEWWQGNHVELLQSNF